MQISIFTCMVKTANGGTHSYAMLSNDTWRGTTAALLAVQKTDDINENGPIYGTAVYISDRASTDFKNWF